MTTSRNSDMRAIADKIAEAGLVSKAATHVAAELGSNTAQGKVDQMKLAKKLKSEYKRYLGQTGKKADETSLMQFLVANIGFTATNARELFKQSGIQDPINKTESVILELDGSQMDKLFTNAAQFAFAHNLVGKDAKSGKVHGRYDQGYGYDGRYGSRYRDRNDPLSRIADIADDKPGDPPAKPAVVTTKPAAAKQADPKAAAKGDVSSTGSLDKNKMKGVANKLGLDDSDLEDLNYSVNQDDYHTLVGSGDPTAMKQLAIVGYAYLKANGK